MKIEFSNKPIPENCKTDDCINRDVLAILRERISSFAYREIIAELDAPEINLPPRKFLLRLRDITASVLLS